MNAQALKALLVLHGETAGDLARVLNINRSTVSMKMTGKSDFTRDEMNIMRQRYNLTPKQITDIFFTE